MRDYAREMAAYTRGRGHLTCTFRGLDVCRNQEEVLARTGYEPDRDEENPSDPFSVPMARDILCPGRKCRITCICLRTRSSKGRRKRRPRPGERRRRPSGEKMRKSWKRFHPHLREGGAESKGRLEEKGSCACGREGKEKNVRPRQSIFWWTAIM